jgi:hypothetical protein
MMRIARVRFMGLSPGEMNEDLRPRNEDLRPRNEDLRPRNEDLRPREYTGESL